MSAHASRIVGICQSTAILIAIGLAACSPVDEPTIVDTVSDTPVVRDTAVSAQQQPSDTTVDGSTGFADTSPTIVPGKASKFAVHLESQIDELIENGSNNCIVEQSVKQSIEFYSTKSLRYLRSYTNVADLSGSDIVFITKFLETERGRYGRLCDIDNGGTPFDFTEPSDLQEYLDAWIEKESSEGNYCKIARNVENSARMLLSNDIEYLRTYYELPNLDPNYIVYLVRNWIDESEHYSGLCDRQD